MLHKKQKQVVESSQKRRVVRTSELRSSQYTYHGDRRDSRDTSRENVPRQMHRGDDNPTRGQAQEARGVGIGKLLRRRRFMYMAGSSVLIVLFISAVFLQTSPSVQLVDGYENQQTLRQNEVYKQAAAKYLAGSLANNNKITVDGEGLERHMRQAFPELQLVQLTIPLFGFQPTLVIQPSRPLVLLQTVQGNTVVIDESGYVISTVEDFKGDSLPTVVDQSATTVALGKQVLPKSSMQFIASVLAQYTAKSISVESLILPRSAYELNVRSVGDSYYVKYSMLNATSVTQQVGGYFSMREYLTLKQITPAEYVDVRLNGRAYYK